MMAARLRCALSLLLGLSCCIGRSVAFCSGARVTPIPALLSVARGPLPHLSCRTRPGTLSPALCVNNDGGKGEVSIGWKKEAAKELPTGAMPIIPVPADRMSLPGQLKEAHLYDNSNLAVLRYASKHTGGYYVQAVIDEEAMADRKFRLCKYGVLRKILGTTAGIHRNHLGERSDSIRARLLGMGRVQVGDVVQREPFVAAQVAAAPLEYLPKKSSDFTRLAELYAKCENLRVSLGEDALQNTPFRQLSDLGADASHEEVEGGGQEPWAEGGEESSAADEQESMTPEELRAMVQRRVADAMGAGAAGGGGTDGAGGSEAASRGSQDAEGALSEAGEGPWSFSLARGPLPLLVNRVLDEASADGRRTRPGMTGGVGATVPFLLPSVFTESEGLAVLAALRYLPPNRRLTSLSQENGKQLLMDVLDGLEDALAALTELERQWSR